MRSFILPIVALAASLLTSTSAERLPAESLCRPIADCLRDPIKCKRRKQIVVTNGLYSCGDHECPDRRCASKRRCKKLQKKCKPEETVTCDGVKCGEGEMCYIIPGDGCEKCTEASCRDPKEMRISPVLGRLRIQRVRKDWASTFPSYPKPFRKFYHKFINVNGFPVTSSDNTTDKALIAGAKWVRTMLNFAHPSVTKNLVDRKGKLAILATIGQETPLSIGPEATNEGVSEKRRGGFLPPKHLSYAGSEDLLCDDPREGGGANCILIHEFAHHMHIDGLSPGMQQRISEAYKNANNTLWNGTYGMSNELEYFAEGVMMYFDCQKFRFGASIQHYHRETREGLKAHDPILAEIIEEIFQGNYIRYTCPDGQQVRKCDDEPDKNCAARGNNGECDVDWAISENSLMFWECPNTCGVCTGLNA